MLLIAGRLYKTGEALEDAVILGSELEEAVIL